MRPEKLVISAFGPYAEQVNIDFSSLGERGLYLISGNTGAGKSTIFEAIRFVLYGGEDNNELRSKYARKEMPTFVELQFTLRGEEYLIRRNPKYRRPRTRGEGETDEKANAELIMPEGKIHTGYSTVTEVVKDLLGLNCEQFSKIVMIAQGKFRELLEADTVSRSKIFRDIFKTSSYDELQKMVKSRFLEANKKYGKLNDSIKQYVKGILLPENTENLERLIEIMAQDRIVDISEVIVVLNDLNEKEGVLLKTGKESFAHNQKNIQDKTEGIARQEALKGNIERLVDELNKMRRYESVAAAVMEAYENEEKLQPERERLLVLIDNQKKSLEKYKLYEERLIELNKAIEIGSELEFSYNEKISIKEELESKLKLYEEEIISTEGVELELITLANFIRESENFIKALVKLIELHNTYEKSIAKYKENVNIYSDKKSKEEMCRVIYDKALKSFLDGQAGIMADNLRRNPSTPCPVCGSIHYVKLAELTEEVYSEEQVNDCKEECDVATKEAISASEAAGIACEVMENCGERLREAIKETGFSWDVTQIEECAGEHIKEETDRLAILKGKKEGLEAAAEKRKKIMLKVPDLKEELIKAEELIAQVKANHYNNQLKVKELETKVNTMKAELSNEDKKQAVNELANIQAKYNKMVVDYKRASEDKDSYLRDKATCQAVIEELYDQIKVLLDSQSLAEDIHHICSSFIIKNSVSVSDSEQLAYMAEKLSSVINTDKTSLIQWKEDNEKLSEENHKLYARVTGNTHTLENLVEQQKSLETISKKLVVVKALSDTLNGEVDGKDKIKLETFVQISYFEQVIDKANTKLFEMTEGQYEFIRGMSGENKKIKSGLELSVYDHYNGTTRSVKTLSGGESFMASLSLALGMADIIEESASGISIDTMFIDEGFGSLDETALEQAMKVLAKLSEGNKLVGIISHVGSLRERIDKQISVSKASEGGSYISV